MLYSNINWEKIRGLFPACKNYTYVNAGEASPIPQTVADAAIQFYTEMAAGGDTYWDMWDEKKEKVRIQVAKFIGAEAEEIAFTQNASQGMNIVADILKGKGEILTMDEEFPASTIPWLYRKYKVHFIKPENHIYTMKNIQRHCTNKTKILITSHVQYCTGFKQNLEKLGQFCQKNKILFVVNATQSLGVMPLDVHKSNIDFLVASGYKWTLSGHGIGILYINKRLLPTIHYPGAGWNSVKNPYQWNNKNITIRKEASEIELGNFHFPNIFALGSAIRLLNTIGINNIQRRIFELNDYLVKDLQKLNFTITSPLQKEYRSGITIVQIDSPDEVVRKLRKRNIILSKRGEGIRITMHIYNNTQDINRLIQALKDCR
jgi:cysteine desulfurase/selenocysteine lyase